MREQLDLFGGTEQKLKKRLKLRKRGSKEAKSIAPEQTSAEKAVEETDWLICRLCKKKGTTIYSGRLEHPVHEKCLMEYLERERLK